MRAFVPFLAFVLGPLPGGPGAADDPGGRPAPVHARPRGSGAARVATVRALWTRAQEDSGPMVHGRASKQKGSTEGQGRVTRAGHRRLPALAGALWRPDEPRGATGAAPGRGLAAQHLAEDREEGFPEAWSRRDNRGAGVPSLACGRWPRQRRSICSSPCPEGRIQALRQMSGWCSPRPAELHGSFAHPCLRADGQAVFLSSC